MFVTESTDNKSIRRMAGKRRGLVEMARIGSVAGIEPTGELAQLAPTQLKVLEGVHLGLLNKQIAYISGSPKRR